MQRRDMGARYGPDPHAAQTQAFGLAIDLNVAQNERGIVGQMNRTAVSIVDT